MSFFQDNNLNEGLMNVGRFCLALPVVYYMGWCGLSLTEKMDHGHPMSKLTWPGAFLIVALVVGMFGFMIFATGYFLFNTIGGLF